jgi:hypothetical protein
MKKFAPAKKSWWFPLAGRRQETHAVSWNLRCLEQETD